MWQQRIQSMLGVRALTCWFLLIATYSCYMHDKTEAAAALGTLLTTAVTWMFKSRSDREARNGNQ